MGYGLELNENSPYCLIGPAEKVGDPTLAVQQTDLDFNSPSLPLNMFLPSTVQKEPTVSSGSSTQKLTGASSENGVHGISSISPGKFDLSSIQGLSFSPIQRNSSSVGGVLLADGTEGGTGGFELLREERLVSVPLVFKAGRGVDVRTYMAAPYSWNIPMPPQRHL
ncbi:hypothetical protein Salat_0239500 [Sesamum alatum]|uniref:Uncharacterized protein n=1 Tax=Sesamum alatum TaxID=300844 RepID=A0AAE1Z098_9LAMI|nr:hypothetical protein Salat_0239500 [Sesamum alatum]